MLVATILGSSMVFIDGSVVNVALPEFQREFHASASEVQWVVEAYALFLAALLLVGGSLGDRLGRRRVFLFGTTLFAFSSILCGLSPATIWLIVARALQGVGGALLVPGSLALISAAFQADQRGRAIGTWSGFTSVTSVLGPLLGGWLVQVASWRWVFFLNVPLAVTVLLVSFRGVPESRDEETSGRLDWPGALLVTLGLAGIVYGLIQSGAAGLGQPEVLSALALGTLALVLFFLVEASSAHPMVPLRLFRSRSFLGANLLTFLLYGALSAGTYFIPFNLIQVQGYTPAMVGASLTPFALTMFLFSRWTGGLVRRFGSKLPLIVGPSITALGFALYALPGIGGSYWLTFFPAVIVMSLGMTVTVAPLTTTVMNAVEQQAAGTASGINNAVSRTAGLMAIAFMGLVMVNTFSNSLAQHLAALPLSADLRQTIQARSGSLAGLTLPPDTSSSTRALLQRAIDQSFVSGFRIVVLICAVLALASSVAAAVLIEGKRQARVSEGDEEAAPAVHREQKSS
ncbi:MFS transporter [Ktedonobacter robiniae]|uniref:MFS transporter n=1 Tax=Ktedonobacter robiniae TaxID=2778365 RepID=A0ABQ3V7C4_9CHLR|nr:MFS transporter [Ktedonobacter robiniae]